MHAFDDPRTAAGQGTIGLELMAQRPDVGTVVVPIGGGGLIAAIAVAVKAIDPTVRIVGVQAGGLARRTASRLAAARPLLEYPAARRWPTASPAASARSCSRTATLIDEDVLVREDEIEDAMVALLAQDQVVAEAVGRRRRRGPARGPGPPTEGRPVAVVVTGANVDARVLARLLHARA